jgi:hypothetical protein
MKSCADVNEMVDNIDPVDFENPFSGVHFKCDDGDYVHQKMYKESSLVKGSNRSFRTSAIVKLGGKCSCCGEEDWNVLDIDHINGDGKEDRGNLKRQKMFKSIAREGSQGKYQLLCGNCHRKKTAKQLGYDTNKYKPDIFDT